MIEELLLVKRPGAFFSREVSCEKFLKVLSLLVVLYNYQNYRDFRLSKVDLRRFLLKVMTFAA